MLRLPSDGTAAANRTESISVLVDETILLAEETAVIAQNDTPFSESSNNHPWAAYKLFTASAKAGSMLRRALKLSPAFLLTDLVKQRALPSLLNEVVNRFELFRVEVSRHTIAQFIRKLDPFFF